MKKIAIILGLVTTLNFTGCSQPSTEQPMPEASNISASENTGISNNGEAGSGVAKVEDYKVTTADDALKLLTEGNNRFVKDQSELINVSSERRDQLKDGQKPYAVVISCSDSRVTPNIVFNAGLGEIFDIRIAGNVVDADALGSIEYGIEHLETPLIVVMGHESCGAVTAAYNKVNKNENVEGNIEAIVEKIEPSVKETTSLEEAINKNIENVVKQIEADKPVKALIDAGKVRIVGAYYGLDGKVTFK